MHSTPAVSRHFAYNYLAFSGAIPFVLCASFLVFDVNSLPVFGDTRTAFASYTLVITSFMAGSHWGQHINLEGKWRAYLPLFSNAIAISVWLGFLTLSFGMSLIVFTVAFLALLLIDQKLCQCNIISAEYFRTRCEVTSLVVSTLIIAGIFA